MADYTAAPTVAPDPRAPNDYQNIQPKPEQFGALIGRGLERAGQGVEQASSNLFNIAEFQGRVNVDYAGNNYIDTRNKILYGDPDKTTIGADGKPIPDTGFLGLEGRAAADQRQATLDALKTAREEGRKGLTSPREQLEYDNQTRRIYAEAEMHIGQHAESQWKNWAVDVNQAGAKHSLDAYTNNLDDATEMAHHGRDYINFRVQQAQIKFGADPDIASQAIAEAKRDLLKAQVDAVSVKDPAGALRILDKNRVIAGDQYPELVAKYRTRAAAQTGNEIAATKIAQARGGTFAPTVEQAINGAAQGAGLDPAALRRSVQIESGGNPNARTGSYMGLLQLSLPEFDKYKTHPDANIWNIKDNLEAGAAKMRAETAEFARTSGRVPTSFDTYMIHQQGLAGYSMHVNNPEAPAWQNMAGTAEGRQKGAGWAKAAIWGNIPDRYKATFGNVDNVTSRDFIDMWRAKFEQTGTGFAPAIQGNQTGSNAAPVRTAGGAYPTGWAFPPEETLFTSPGRGSQESGTFTPPNVASVIKPSVIQSILDDPAAQADPEVMTHALRAAQASLAAQEIAENQSTKAKKEASDEAAGAFVTAMNDMMHSPNPDYVALAGKINHDLHLTWETKEHLMEKVRHLSGEEQALAFGPGYLAAREALFSPPDAPGHIADFSSLVTRSDITTAGLSDLNTRWRVAKGDVDRASVERRINSILAGMKHRLSFEEDTGFFKLRDPAGEDIYHLQFVPDFIKRASELTEEAAKTGSHEKLDKFLSRENAEKMALAYRDPKKMAADKMTAAGEAGAAPAEPANAPLPPAPDGIDPGKWKSVVASPPPSARTGEPVTHAQWGEVIKMLHDDPSPQMRAAFDRYAAPIGLTSQTVLEKLGAIAPAAPSPATPQANAPEIFPRVTRSPLAEYAATHSSRGPAAIPGGGTRASNLPIQQ